MAKRKKQAAAAEAVPRENLHAREFASEIRLRDPDLEGPPSEDRDTEPAPPPAFHEVGSIWGDFDRTLTVGTLRLEDALHDCTSPIAANHVRQVLDDADALADALFTLWSQARTQHPAWAKNLPRVYRWATEVVEQLEEALVAGSNEDDEILRAFRLLGSYSSLFVNGLIEPALREAISLSVDDEETERLRAVSERAGLLDWTITCAASEPA
jgi:hypothetical protein